MEKEFSLEAILTSTTGVTCVEDFREFIQLAEFVFNDNRLSSLGLITVSGRLKEHLLSLYPQLAEVQYNPQFETSFESWLEEQKKTFGEQLTVSRIDCAIKPAKKHK